MAKSVAVAMSGGVDSSAAEPSRWLVLDATQSKEQIAEQIWERVRTALTRKDQGL